MMTYAFVDTYHPRLRKYGAFWSPSRYRVNGTHFQGAVQIYLRLPRLSCRVVSPSAPAWQTPPRWGDRIDATAWTGRTRAFDWWYDPGFLNVELRTPTLRRYSWKVGRL